MLGFGGEIIGSKYEQDTLGEGDVIGGYRIS